MPTTFSQADRTFTVTTPLGADVFGLTAFTCREGISRPFELTLDLFAPSDTTVAFDRLLGEGVTVAVQLAEPGTKRHFHGIVRSVARRGTEAVERGARTAYRLVVVPKTWLLAQGRRSRLFQRKTVPEILETVLAGVTLSKRLQGTYEPRELCVQYRESDFAFASRLMEEEGIYYFFTHADGAHTMVLGDAPITHPALADGATIAYDPGIGGLRPDARIVEWERVQELTAKSATLWDHNFELPGRNLEAKSPIGQTVAMGTVSHRLQTTANAELEVYDYPGEYAKRFDGIATGGSEQASSLQKVFQDNLRTAKLRAGEIEARSLRAFGASDCRQLATGHRFTLTGHPDADGEYVLLEVEHEGRSESPGRSGGDEGLAYQNRFTAIPAALAYRPPRATRRPRMDGCQTATVVGPSGEEIFTDKYGRVKVQFHWDREGQLDANSSGWVRVASMWAGAQWGAIHIPRIGQEVVVDFLEGDPDRPIIVGSVYNANQMPPYTLPDNKTQSGIKSRSSAQGAADTFNEIRFEDKKDAEQIFMQAQKDLETLVKHDETRTVWHDRTTTVLNDDTRTVGGKDKDGNEIGGNDVVTVTKGNRTITVSEGNLATTVAKGNVTTTVSEGNETHDVAQGTHTMTVKGDTSLTVQTGKLATTVSQGHHETTVSAGNAKLDVSAGKYEITAAQEIVLKVGGSSIKITPTAIEISAATSIELKVGPTKVALGPAGLQASGVQTKIEGTAQLELKGGAMAKVEGGAMLQLQGGAMTTVKGGVVMVN